MSKSAQAFRTIREVADWLGVAAHVLRFWESKFNQIKPVKRAGGRRYYRPADMELVGGIKVLLHDRGLTIRGVQKMIEDEGLQAVTSLSPPVDELISDSDVIDHEPADEWAEDTAAEESTPMQDVPEPSVAPEEPAEDAPPVTATEEGAPVALDVPEDAPTDPVIDPVADLAPDPAPDLGPDLVPDPAEDHAPLASHPEPTAPLPAFDPAEGPLGALAALSQLPEDQRSTLGPQIAALAQLRDRMSAPLRPG